MFQSFQLCSPAPASCQGVPQSSPEPVLAFYFIYRNRWGMIPITPTFRQWQGKSEIRSQRSEVRDQRSEIRSQRSEIRDQKSEIRGQKSETNAILLASDL